MPNIYENEIWIDQCESRAEWYRRQDVADEPRSIQFDGCPMISVRIGTQIYRCAVVGWVPPVRHTA